MIGQMVITFRESFEAILLLSILTAYLKKTGRGELIKNAYYGVILALIIGLTVSVIVLEFYNGFENKELFEGVSALIAVVILTSMIYWMGLKGSSLKAEIMRRVDSKRTSLAILGTAFFFVVREVIETILFLIPFAIAGGFSTAIGSIAGLSFAILFSLSISNSISKVKLRRFFLYSSILLVLIAGGLVGYGVHELLEYSEKLGFNSPLHVTAFELSINRDSLLHHKNIIGSFLAVMFGYTVKAEVGRMIAHFLYLLIAFTLIYRAYASKPTTKTEIFPILSS